MESIEYLGRQLPLLGHYDTVVVGGGAAGAAAGIRCAIDGQKVLLVEKGQLSVLCQRQFRIYHLRPVAFHIARAVHEGQRRFTLSKQAKT